MSARTNTPAAGGEFLLGDDRPVNRLGLGAMRLALGGSIRDPDAAIELLRRAAELGVNHIDTAGFYGVGSMRSHEFIREPSGRTPTTSCSRPRSARYSRTASCPPARLGRMICAAYVRTGSGCVSYCTVTDIL